MSLPSPDESLSSIPLEVAATPEGTTVQSSLKRPFGLNRCFQMRAILDDIKKQRVRHFSPGEPRKRKRMNPTKKR